MATFEELCKELSKAFEDDGVEIENVKALMKSYTSRREEWERFAKFGQQGYTRNLVDEGNGKYNLLILCWNKDQGSSIHSHSGSRCFVKILSGTIKEEQFEWPSDSREETEMRKTKQGIYEENSVSYIDDSIALHRMKNNSPTEGAVTLHLYSPPFKTCKTFDEKTGHESVGEMKLWSKYGQKVKENDSSN